MLCLLQLWEPKMCRLALQLLGMLGNVLGRPRHVLQRPQHALQGPWPTSACFCKVLGVPHRRETPNLLPYKLWIQGISVLPSFIYGSLVIYYSLGFTAYKTASGVVSFRCGTPRTLQKHVEVSQGPYKACQGRCKACWERCKTCRGQPRTSPSMPRSCKVSLHILGFHNNYFKGK